MTHTSVSSAARQFYLRDRVHYCETSDGVVFLDLRRGKYIGLGGTELQSIAPYLNASTDPGEASKNIESSLDYLVAQDLLTTDPSQGRDGAPPCRDVPVVAAADLFEHMAPKISIGQALRFLTACARAAFKLRFRSLGNAVATVRRRKLRRSNHGRRVPSEGELLELVSIFVKLRPLVFSDYCKCLFDSLALTEFLAANDVYADWTLGVKTQPFSAHSWVQMTGIVLNDTPERVSAFSPILIV